MRFFKPISLVLLSLLLVINAIAQPVSSKTNSTKLVFLGLAVSGGSIVTGSQRVKPLSYTHPVMLQFDFSLIANTQQSWSYCNCYSKTGISISYTDFNNPGKLGHASNFNAFTEPIIYYSPKFQFSIRGGAGFSYLNNVYDAESNPENLFYSSPLSFMLYLKARAAYRLSRSFNASVTGEFNHISNGGTRYPNWGINFPMVSLGVDYQLKSQTLIPRTRSELAEHPLKLIMRAYGGRHLEDGTKKIVTGISGGLIKHVSRINGIGIGGEISYDAIYKVLEERKGTRYNSLLTSVSIQHYFFYGKLLFGQQLAYYLIPPNPEGSKKLYQLYTLEYHVKKDWYAGASLKARAGISDYLVASISKVIQLR